MVLSSIWAIRKMRARAHVCMCMYVRVWLIWNDLSTRYSLVSVRFQDSVLNNSWYIVTGKCILLFVSEHISVISKYVNKIIPLNFARFSSSFFRKIMYARTHIRTHTHAHTQSSPLWSFYRKITFYLVVVRYVIDLQHFANFITMNSETEHKFHLVKQL